MMHGPETPRHPIRVVTRRTGLSPSVLRAWERRYEAVQPTRSDGGQRIYSDREVRRLSLLVQVTDAGRSIGQVAGLSDEELEALVREDASAEPPALARDGDVDQVELDLVVRHAVAAVEALDTARLHRLLMRAAVVLDPELLVDDVILPLLTRIGRLWQDGTVGPADEHLASGVIRAFLEWLMRATEVPGDAPVLVCGTPSGHRHEMGALLCGVVAAGAGWRPVFLGPDLPADELAAAARRLGARTVAISALHAPADEGLSDEIATLLRLVPRGVEVVVGGPAAMEHRDEIERAGGRVLPSLDRLRTALAQQIA